MRPRPTRPPLRHSATPPSHQTQPPHHPTTPPPHHRTTAPSHYHHPTNPTTPTTTQQPNNPTNPTNPTRSSNEVDGPGGSLKVQKDIGASLEPRNVDRFFHTARMYIEDDEQAILASHSGGSLGVDLGVHMEGAILAIGSEDEGELEAVKEEVLAALGQWLGSILLRLSAASYCFLLYSIVSQCLQPV